MLGASQSSGLSLSLTVLAFLIVVLSHRHHSPQHERFRSAKEMRPYGRAEARPLLLDEICDGAVDDEQERCGKFEMHDLASDLRLACLCFLVPR